MLRKLFQSQMGWVLAGGMILGGIGMALFIRGNPAANAQNPPAVMLSAEEADALSTLDSALVKLTERLMPSVVNIRSGRGEGSGVIIRSDGWILTNQHVVQESEEVEVVLNSGESLKGTVRKDAFSDLAVVKIDKKGLTAVRFADSEEVRTGQMTLAIGSPMGLSRTATFGHVSALGRPALVPENTPTGVRAYFDMIQTDAAINPGNSGGPLMDANGHVIGINTVINSTTGSNSGIGFAIPANTARTVSDQLIENGKVVRAYMGLQPANITEFQAQKAGVKQGAIVETIPTDLKTASPAKDAGIKVGDVITKINDVPVRSEMDVRNAMLTNRPGTTVSVEYVRDGQKKSVNVKLTDRPAIETASQPQPDFREFGGPRMEQPPISEPGKPAVLGVRVRETTPDEAKLSPTGGAVIVTSVADGSIASRYGVKSGSMILQLGDDEIKSVKDLDASLKKFKTGDRTMLIYGSASRSGSSQVSVTITF